jgi:hypothetical protein
MQNEKGRRFIMKKLRKTLGDPYQPEIRAIMKLIETQSKTTLVNWVLGYAEENYLPLVCDGTNREMARNALNAANEWLCGKIKLPEAKRYILACHEAAREAEGNPSEQAALRAIGQAASTIHAATHALGIAFYGAAAVFYSGAERIAGGNFAENNGSDGWRRDTGIIDGAEDCGKIGLAANAEACAKNDDYSDMRRHFDTEDYDKIAAEEFQRIYESLKAASIENEQNPVKVNWNC